ncbi:hypothetical protein ABPG74_003469 [Tetrahymena malaccensis]
MNSTEIINELVNFNLRGDFSSHSRMLTSHSSEEFSNGGQVAGAIVGIIYVFAFTYYLSVKFFNHIIEDIVYLVNYKEEEDKEIYRPLVYCVLNSIPVLAFAMCCVIRTDYDSGIMLIFSTDMINIFLIYGLILIFVILPVKKEGSDIDGWQLLRDSIWYCVGLSLFVIFLFENLVTWWAGIVMVCYYFSHMILQSYNETIREEMFLLVGLKHEDDLFNADEQARQKKRRLSITELSYKNCVDKTDEELQKKIRRMDALIRVKYKDQQKKKDVYTKWQVAVYTVIFAIRNKHKDEKNQRSINYAKLFAPVKNCSLPSDQQSQQEFEQKQIQNEVNEEDVLIHKDGGDIEDQAESKKPNSERKIKNEDAESENMDNFSNKFGNGYQQQLKGDNQSNQDVKPNLMMNEDPQMIQMMDNQYDDVFGQQEKFQVSLAFPSHPIDIFCYIVFFPIHLIIYLLPNYHLNPSHRKLAGSFLVNMVIICALMVCLQYLIDNVAGYLFYSHNSILSISITGLFLQLPFFIYNYQFAKKEKDPVDFLLTFLQLGIFKIGIVLGIVCIVSSIANASSDVNVKFHQHFKVILLIMIGIIIGNIIVLNTNSLKANKNVSRFLVLGYAIFFISSIILLAV